MIPQTIRKLRKLLQISGSLPSSQQPLNRKCHGKITNTKFLHVSIILLGKSSIHPSIPPISAISWSFPLHAPYWTVPWQLPATPLQRYVAAPLPCHASDGVHELRRWQRQQPPVAKPPSPVLFICCCWSILTSSYFHPPHKNMGFKF